MRLYLSERDQQAGWTHRAMNRYRRLRASHLNHLRYELNALHEELQLLIELRARMRAARHNAATPLNQASNGCA